MSGTVELFAQLTCEFEDLHVLADEGQADGQPDELLLILSTQICNGLQRCKEFVGQIDAALGAA